MIDVLMLRHTMASFIGMCLVTDMEQAAWRSGYHGGAGSMEVRGAWRTGSMEDRQHGGQAAWRTGSMEDRQHGGACSIEET